MSRPYPKVWWNEFALTWEPGDEDKPTHKVVPLSALPLGR